MKIYNTKIFKKHISVLFFLFGFWYSAFSQISPVSNDSTLNTFSFKDLSFPDPSSIIKMYNYDPLTDRYYFTSKVGDFNINYPIILTPKEFQELISNENLKAYYKEKIDAYEGLKVDEDDKKNLIPRIPLQIKFIL